MTDASMHIGSRIAKWQAREGRCELIHLEPILRRLRTQQRAEVQFREDDRAEADSLGRMGGQTLTDEEVFAAQVLNAYVAVEQKHQSNSTALGSFPCGGRTKVSSSMEPNVFSK